MIGLAMEKWPDDALRRVVDAPVEKWDLMSFRNWKSADGCPRCLCGHWLDLTPARRGVDTSAPVVDRISERAVYLAYRFGTPRTVRAVKLRALAILLRRHPLDAKIAVLRAEVG